MPRSFPLSVLQRADGEVAFTGFVIQRRDGKQKTKQKQNKTKQNKTKQNKTIQLENLNITDPLQYRQHACTPIPTALLKREREGKEEKDKGGMEKDTEEKIREMGGKRMEEREERKGKGDGIKGKGTGG